MEKIPHRLNALFDAPEKFLLLTDFDGTLVEQVDDPAIVAVPDTLRADLQNLYENSPLDFVIVTGRPVSAIDGFMGGARLPVLGGHGIELRLDPDQPTAFLGEALPEELRQLFCEKGREFGCYVEDKIYSLSLHARAPEIYEHLENALADSLRAHDLTCRLRRIGRTFEILQCDLNKGSGIAHLLERNYFPDKKIIYIGDDTRSDESLETVAQKGGTLIAMGRDQAGGQKDYFESPAALRDFLSTLATTLTQDVKKRRMAV